MLLADFNPNDCEICSPTESYSSHTWDFNRQLDAFYAIRKGAGLRQRQKRLAGGRVRELSMSAKCSLSPKKKDGVRRRVGRSDGPARACIAHDLIHVFCCTDSPVSLRLSMSNTVRGVTFLNEGSVEQTS